MSKSFAIPYVDSMHDSRPFFMAYELVDMPDSLHYFMADTEKLIAKINQDDPEMMAHAWRKFEGDCPENWLRYNSEENPCKGGVFTFGEFVNWEGRLSLRQKIKYQLQKFFSFGRHFYFRNGLPLALTMSGGCAENLILIQKLKLPFVPVAVHKEDPDDELRIEYLKRLIGTESVH